MEKVEFTICILAIFLSVCICVDQTGNRRYSDILNVGFANPPQPANKPQISPISLSYAGYELTTLPPRSTPFSYSGALQGGSRTGVQPANINSQSNAGGGWPQLSQRGPQPRPTTQSNIYPTNNRNSVISPTGTRSPSITIRPNLNNREQGPVRTNSQTQPNGQPQTNNQNQPFSYSNALSGSNNNRPQLANPTTAKAPVITNNNPNVQTDLKSGDQNKQNDPEIATDAEIQELSETLLRKDSNNAYKYITANYQGRTTSGATSDEAPLPLLTVNQSAYDITTIALMRPLFNNYELDTSVNEHVTPQERTEESALLDAMLSTNVMRQLMTFLTEKGIVTRDPKTHKDLLKTIWFNLYSRGGGRIGSSAFEHVFVAELKNGEVTGLHNWVYFNDEEMANHVNYMGYIKKVDLGQKGAVLKLRFNLNNVRKPVNSIFIGTSPELEMALYTLCFTTRADKACNISLNGKRVNIRTYTFRYRGKKMIGSAFPEI